MAWTPDLRSIPTTEYRCRGRVRQDMETKISEVLLGGRKRTKQIYEEEVGR